jgi:hypothetical protein
MVALTGLPAPRLVEEDGMVLIALEDYPLAGEGPTVSVAVAALITQLREWAYDWPDHRTPAQAQELVRFISRTDDAELAAWVTPAG